MHVTMKDSVIAVIVMTVAFATAIHSQPDSKEIQDAASIKEDFYVTDPSANFSFFIKEGDMTFIAVPERDIDTVSSKHKRNARIETSYRWPNARVPYVIPSVFNEEERRVILSAMNHWEVNTCVRFHPRRNEAYYIVFMVGNPGVCSSFVGRLRSYYQPQGVTLGARCVYFPTVVHELGHAIGFYHEQSRPDRDEHIEVIYDNINPNLARNFRRIDHSSVNLFGLGYDYASIMHYSSRAFSQNGGDTIRAKDPTIPIGGARELSPLDIAKANAHYNCGPKSRHPPISTLAPNENVLTLPPGVTCGEVITATTSGTFRSPGFPSHRHNQDCAWILQAPKGYDKFKISFPRLQLESSSSCSRDYVQIYEGTSLSPSNLISSFGNRGRICTDRNYYVYNDVVTVYYHTDSSNRVSNVRGLEVTFSALDMNECRRANRCHSCRNTEGSYECDCRDGYYHSVAANTCYDINECAYSNGRCQHKCINKGGSYRCECEAGLFLQNDGHSCGRTKPTVPPPTPQKCGRNMTVSRGSFQTPNWPETYPVNLDCEWFIEVPTDKVIQISFEVNPFGIAGNLPQCEKDYLLVYDGHSHQDTSFGPFCHYTVPDQIKTTSNLAKVVFHAGPAHSPSRRGFKANYITVDAPVVTTMPPTTEPPTSPQCGRNMTASMGSFNSPNWPETYPVNIDCEWFIEVSTDKLIQISFERNPFGIAGTLPQCEKDYLLVYDGHSHLDTSFGPFCHFTVPDQIKTTTNLAKVVFHAGPVHGPSRRGFKANYITVDVPVVTTLPPPPPQTTIMPSPPPPSTNTSPTLSTESPTSPQCGRVLTEPSGSFSSPNWPRTYPVNVDCEWIIICDSSKVVKITFREFSIAGNMPDCVKDWVKVVDGLELGATESRPFCYYTKPRPITTLSNKVKVVLHAGPAHSPSRTGFLALYQCLDNPNPPTISPPTLPAHTTPSVSLPTPLPPPEGTIYSCGGFIRHGTHFASPGYHGLPGELHSGSYCRWNVVGGAAGGHRYTFNVKYLHLPSCSVGSLVVTDVLRGNHRTTLCGSSTEIPYEYHTTNNIFRVELRVNDVQSFGGFLAILE